MSLLEGLAPQKGPDDLERASRAFESLMLKQMLKAGGLGAGKSEAGGTLVQDLFIDVMADAIAASGGIGLSKLVASSAAPPGAPPAHSAHPPGVSPDLLSLVPGQHARQTSGFGGRLDPLERTPSMHSGVDVAAPEGSPIAAALDGVVVSAGPRGGYGNAVEVDHGGGLHTLYAHASNVLVRPGEVVKAGQTLAEVGQTGRTTGPHLHFEARKDGRPVDPARALKAYGF